MANIWTEAADAHSNRFFLKRTQFPRHFKKFKGFLQGYGFEVLAGTQTGKAGFRNLFIGRGFPQLGNGPEFAYLHRNLFSTERIHTEQPLPAALFTGLKYSVDQRMKRLVKTVDDFMPHQLSFGNLIETLLNAGRKVIVHDLIKMTGQKVGDDHPDIGGKKLALFGTRDFLFHLAGKGVSGEFHLNENAFLSWAVFPDHIIPVLDGGDGGGISRRPADTQFLKPFDQGGLGEPWRPLGIAFRGLDLQSLQGHPLSDRWKQHLPPLGGRFLIGRLHVDFQKTVENDHLSGCDELLGRRRHGNGDDSPFQLRISHL